MSIIRKKLNGAAYAIFGTIIVMVLTATTIFPLFATVWLFQWMTSNGVMSDGAAFFLTFVFGLPLSAAAGYLCFSWILPE